MSLFTSDEKKGLFSLKDTTLIKAGNIRGPVSKWSISGNVYCGEYSSINGPFNARGNVSIGKYCAFGQYVSLISGNHRMDMPNQQIWFNERHGFKLPMHTKGPIEIGHNVWIGDKANVLSGVQVGHGCVIAAGSTVTKSFGPFQILVGSPAKCLRKRFSEDVIVQMLEVAWWNWTDDKILRNKKFFELELHHEPDEQRIDLLSFVTD